MKAKVIAAVICAATFIAVAAFLQQVVDPLLLLPLLLIETRRQEMINQTKYKPS